MRHYGERSIALIVFLATGSPAFAASPVFSVFGSYFPAWLVSALLGIVVTVIVRKVFISVGIHEFLPLAPVVYLCLTVAASVAIWLLWTGGGG